MSNTRPAKQLQLAPFFVDQTKPTRRKVCSACKSEKDISAFSAEAKSPDGRQSRCKMCVSYADSLRPKRTRTAAQAARHSERAKAPPRKAARAKYAKSKPGRLARFKCDIKKKYGISIDEWRSMWSAQSGKCARCSVCMVEPPQLSGRNGRTSVTDACVDHCHSTGIVRALLCGPCNRRIGHLERPDSRHIGDLEYLSRFTSSHQK